jgi:hypothetical protein
MSDSNYGIGKCVDCRHEQRVASKEWLKASPPRCRNCGGRLEEVVVSVEVPPESSE